MKKALLWLLSVCLVVSMCVLPVCALAGTSYRYCPGCGSPLNSSWNYCASCRYYVGTDSPVDQDADEEETMDGFSGTSFYATANQGLAGRSGPDTNYTEPGGYELAGQRVRILSKVQTNSVTWVQFEINYHGSPMRAYTGAKRFNFDTVSLASIPTEHPRYEYATLTRYATPRRGPGWEYIEEKEYPFGQDELVYILAEENGWYQFELDTGYGIPGHPDRVYRVRGWLPKSYFRMGEGRGHGY